MTTLSKARQNALYADTVVSVKDFGAVGDGTTDDTAAIQAAIDTGNPVYIPPSTYKTTSPLTMSTVASIGQRAYGAGPAREDNGSTASATEANITNNATMRVSFSYQA